MIVGWTNFIIVPSLKLAVECSRQIDEESAKNLSVTIKELFDEENSVCDILEEPHAKISAKNWSAILEKAATADKLSGHYHDYLLAVWLLLRKTDFQIISEFDFEKFNKTGFKVLRFE